MERLTDEERATLEQVIGYGLTEVGVPFEPDDPVVSACRKLGLRPRGWQGEHVLPEPDEG